MLRFAGSCSTNMSDCPLHIRRAIAMSSTRSSSLASTSATVRCTARTEWLRISLPRPRNTTMPSPRLEGLTADLRNRYGRSYRVQRAGTVPGLPDARQGPDSAEPRASARLPQSAMTSAFALKKESILALALRVDHMNGVDPSSVYSPPDTARRTSCCLVRPAVRIRCLSVSFIDLHVLSGRAHAICNVCHLAASGTVQRHCVGEVAAAL